MFLIDTIKRLFTRSHKSVDKTGRQLDATVKDSDFRSLSGSDVPPTFLVSPMIHQLMGAFGDVSMIGDLYKLARFSFQTAHSDPRIEESFSHLRNKSTQPNDRGRAFEIAVAPEFEKTIWQEIDAFAENLKLFTQVREAMKFAYLEGETYYRAIFDTSLNPIRVHAIEKLPGPKDGFEMHGPRFSDPEIDGDYVLVEKSTMTVVNRFRGFEIIPFKRDAQEFDDGFPILASLFTRYPKLEEMEKVLPIMRKFRSGMREIYQYDQMAPEQFKKFVDEQRKLEQNKGENKPFASTHTMARDVKSFSEVSSALWNIGDIDYMLRAALSAIGTPIFLLSTMTKEVPNRATADTIYDDWIKGEVAGVEHHLAGSLPRMRWGGGNWMDGMGLLKLLGLQIFLWGENPLMVKPVIEWPEKSRMTTEEIDALQKLRDKGSISETTFARRMANIDYEQELKLMASEKELRDKILGVQQEPVATDNNDGGNNDGEFEEIVTMAKRAARHTDKYSLNGD